MGKIVVACYKPKPEKAAALDQLMKTHVEILREEGLATDRKSIVMKAQDGTAVEDFEWKSQEAIQSAHANPHVLMMWEDYAQVCDYIEPAKVAEFQQLFSEFESAEWLTLTHHHDAPGNDLVIKGDFQ